MTLTKGLLWFVILNEVRGVIVVILTLMTLF